jgi:hypothetical protein
VREIRRGRARAERALEGLILEHEDKDVANRGAGARRLRRGHAERGGRGDEKRDQLRDGALVGAWARVIIMNTAMDTLRLMPKLAVTPDRVSGCTPWLARLLWLFSYARCVAVDRRARQVRIMTRRVWVWRSERVVSFEHIGRIVFRAQALPSFSLWRYLWSGPDDSDSAFFLISLALKDRDELPLFMVWEEQPHKIGWLDQLAGGSTDESPIGDEAAVSIVTLLREYIGVPIAQH